MAMEWTESLKQKHYGKRRLNPVFVFFLFIVLIFLWLVSGAVSDAVSYAECGQGNMAEQNQMKQLLRDIANAEKRQATSLDRIATQIGRCLENDKEIQ